MKTRRDGNLRDPDARGKKRQTDTQRCRERDTQREKKERAPEEAAKA